MARSKPTLSADQAKLVSQLCQVGVSWVGQRDHHAVIEIEELARHVQQFIPPEEPGPAKRNQKRRIRES